MKPTKEFISYSGPFCIKMISVIANYVADYLKVKNVPVMKVYRVFIELSQNVALYSANRHYEENGSSVGIGSLFVCESDNHIVCRTYNQILPEHRLVLEANCNRINSSPDSELKKMKEKLRRESSLLDTGAHIGLISIALFSGNKLEFDFKEEAGQLFFSISTTIFKNN